MAGASRISPRYHDLPWHAARSACPPWRAKAFGVVSTQAEQFKESALYSSVFAPAFRVALSRLWSDLQPPRLRHYGILPKMLSISLAVKARIVCVRMLPSMSAASNTLAAVSSSGASKMHT